MRRRIGIAGALAVVLVALVGSPVLAGGWAAVEVDDAGQVAVGEDTDLTITLLQHGVTPVDFGDVGIAVTNAETGETIRATATPIGGGRWSATLDFPAAGSWQLEVRHSDLEIGPAAALEVTDSGAVPVAALVATGAAGLAVLGALGYGTLAARRSRTAAATT